MNKPYNTMKAVDDLDTLRHNMVEEARRYTEAHRLPFSKQDKADLNAWLSDVLADTLFRVAKEEDAENADRSEKINGAALARMQKEQLV